MTFEIVDGILTAMVWTDIRDAIAEAIEISKREKRTVTFKHYKSIVCVDKDSNPVLIYRDFKRWQHGLIKTIGPKTFPLTKEEEKSFENVYLTYGNWNKKGEEYKVYLKYKKMFKLHPQPEEKPGVAINVFCFILLAVSGVIVFYTLNSWLVSALFFLASFCNLIPIIGRMIKN